MIESCSGDNIHYQALEIQSLKRRVKSLEKRKKSRTSGFKRLRKVRSASRVESSNDASLGAQEDTSKQGRKITNLDADAEVTLMDETQEMNDDNLMFDTDVLGGQEKRLLKGKLVLFDPVTKCCCYICCYNTTTTRPKARGFVVQEPSEFKTTSSSLQASQIPQAKDKGKGIMVEPEVPLKKKDQVALDEEMARNLEAQLQVELIEEERISRQKGRRSNIALLESWDNTQAMMDADFQLAQQMQTEEQEQLSIEENLIKMKGWDTLNLLRVAWRDTKRYSSMIKMLQGIDREDLETLWKLVKAKHENTRLEDDYERVLWGDLKVMFEPDIKSDRVMYR
ncbi:hypothetical protein Tco_1359432 [Tanacetum coccineum]